MLGFNELTVAEGSYASGIFISKSSQVDSYYILIVKAATFFFFIENE